MDNSLTGPTALNITTFFVGSTATKATKTPQPPFRYKAGTGQKVTTCGLMPVRKRSVMKPFARGLGSKAWKLGSDFPDTITGTRLPSSACCPRAHETWDKMVNASGRRRKQSGEEHDDRN